RMTKLRCEVGRLHRTPFPVIDIRAHDGPCMSMADEPSADRPYSGCAPRHRSAGAEGAEIAGKMGERGDGRTAGSFEQWFLIDDHVDGAKFIGHMHLVSPVTEGLSTRGGS